MKFYSLEVNETLKRLDSNEEGLSENEVLIRLNKDGKNKIIEDKRQSKLSKFLNEFKDLMIIILILKFIKQYLINMKKIVL